MRQDSKPIIVERIGAAIDKMRATGVITASVEVSGVYGISSVNSLRNNEVISIDGVNYTVTNVSGLGFSISAATGIDFVGKAWKALAPYYRHGHPKEIVTELAKMDRGDLSFQKYPLIMLIQDFREEVSSFATRASLNFVIANFTDQNYLAEQRYEVNFKPILYPIFSGFLRSLTIYNGTSLLNPDSIEKYDRVYWGKQGLYGVEGNIFHDRLDAIELNNIEIEFKNICK